jgi:hypothetical protein
VIELLDKAEDRVRLHYIEDDSEDIIGIDRDQWIQWLVSQTMNGDMRIWANFDEEGKITSYLVAYDCVDMPVSDHIFIAYFWMDRVRDVNEGLLERAKDWAKSVGAKTLQTSTTEPEEFQDYDFLMSSEKLMEIVV